MLAKQAVNNFAGARAPEQDSDGLGKTFWLSVSSVSRTDRPGLPTTSRFDDCELIDRPAGRA